MRIIVRKIKLTSPELFFKEKIRRCCSTRAIQLLLNIKICPTSIVVSNYKVRSIQIVYAWQVHRDDIIIINEIDDSLIRLEVRIRAQKDAKTRLIFVSNIRLTFTIRTAKERETTKSCGTVVEFWRTETKPQRSSTSESLSESEERWNGSGRRW